MNGETEKVEGAQFTLQGVPKERFDNRDHGAILLLPKTRNELITKAVRKSIFQTYQEEFEALSKERVYILRKGVIVSVRLSREARA